MFAPARTQEAAGIDAADERVQVLFNDGMEKLIALASQWPLVLIALVILIIGIVIAQLVGNSTWLFSRLIKNPLLRGLVRSLVRAAIITLALLIALELLDAMAIVGAVLGAAGLAGLAVGFAFRDTIENYLAGVIMSINRPFGPNDHVQIDTHEGKIMRLTGRATILMTLEGNHLRIPNATVFKSVMTNYSRNPLRRFDFGVGIGTDVDIDAAQKLAVSTLQSLPAVLEDPAPWCVAENLGDSNVLVRVYGWIDQREADFAKTRSEAIKLVKARFEAAEFDMPEPIYRLRIKTASGELAEAQSDAATAAPRRAAAPAVPASPADVAPVTDVDEQVEAERRRSGAEDLLDESAPLE